jgi:hypothetical protein
MNVSFTIPDDVGATFISASRWLYPTRTDLNDNQIGRKALKKFIAGTVDDFTRHITIGENKQELDDLRSIIESERAALTEAERLFSIAKAEFEAGATPTDLGD